MGFNSAFKGLIPVVGSDVDFFVQAILLWYILAPS